MASSAWTVAVMGAGALGSYFGARLLQGGHKVHFIARGQTLDALRSRGIRLIQADGEFAQQSVSATDDPATIGRVDLLLFATKGQHLEQAVPAARPLADGDTVVLPILNGFDISERIADGLGSGIVLAGATRVMARVREPGVVQSSEPRPLILGALHPDHVGIAQETARRLSDGGVIAACSPSIRTEIWLKFIGWAACGGTQCVSGMYFAEILEHADFSPMFDGIVREGEALAAASGVSLPAGLVERLRGALGTYPPDTTISIYDDLRAGIPLELDTTFGAMLALGARLGIPTPAAQRAYDHLRPFADGTR